MPAPSYSVALETPASEPVALAPVAVEEPTRESGVYYNARLDPKNFLEDRCRLTLRPAFVKCLPAQALS